MLEIMDRAINLYREAKLRREEVEHVGANAVLSPELESIEPAATKGLPEQRFCVRCASTQLPPPLEQRAVAEQWSHMSYPDRSDTPRRRAALANSYPLHVVERVAPKEPGEETGLTFDGLGLFSCHAVRARDYWAVTFVINTGVDGRLLPIATGTFEIFSTMS